jgi:hypothetical protein
MRRSWIASERGRSYSLAVFSHISTVGGLAVAGVKFGGLSGSGCLTAAHSSRRSFDDYLDSFVTDSDLSYLESEETARRVVELGFLHGNGELLKRTEFDAKKQAIADYRVSLLNKKPRPLLGTGKQLAGHPLLQVRRKLSCIESVHRGKRGRRHKRAQDRKEPMPGAAGAGPKCRQ